VQELSGPGGGQRQRRQPEILVARRAGAWLVWWVLLMSLWIIVDDSIAVDELLAGAGAAALAAFLAELVTHRAATRFHIRVGWWVAPALGLPGQVVRDMVIVFAALWRRLVRGEQPPSGFREIPARFGDATAEGVSRRVLLVGGRSVAPNTIAAGIDTERDVMVVHQLVVAEGKAAR